MLTSILKVNRVRTCRNGCLIHLCQVNSSTITLWPVHFQEKGSIEIPLF